MASGRNWVHGSIEYRGRVVQVRKLAAWYARLEVGFSVIETTVGCETAAEAEQRLCRDIESLLSEEQPSPIRGAP